MNRPTDESSSERHSSYKQSSDGRSSDERSSETRRVSPKEAAGLPIVDAEPAPSLQLPDPPPEWSRRAPVVAGQGAWRRSPAWGVIVWLAFPCVILAAVRWFVPPLVEEIRYSLARGRQRGEYEAATIALKDQPLAELSLACQKVSQHVGPSVVHIRTVSHDDKTDDEIERLFRSQGPVNIGQGSGVIVDIEGYILTNYHVIRGSKEIRVRLSDGRDVPAIIIGEDSLTDLTVLKINTDKLIAAEWGKSDELQVGALVWAVGSPFGLERSITFGILSAKNRAGMAGQPHQDFLQTDAAVNPGNSGGPLVDSQGRIIGINTAIVGQTYRGISFAIPSEIARDVFQRLKKEGRVSRGWLGVQLDEVTPPDARRLGLENRRGALIGRVVDNPSGPSPARRAGLEVDDVVILWNGHDVDGPSELTRMVAKTEVGQSVSAVIIRNGQEKTIKITVDERPRRFN